jgi:hypothetical protein
MVYSSCPGIFYVGLRTIHETHRLIADSFALVNTAVRSGTNTHMLEVRFFSYINNLYSHAE